MPSWSYDERMDGMGHYLEADELLFGLSDVPTLVPEPELTISYEPVPEPCALTALGLGALLAARRRRRGRRPAIETARKVGALCQPWAHDERLATEPR
jgi:hypothetical protein